MFLICLFPVVILACVLFIFHLTEPEGMPIAGVAGRCFDALSTPGWFTIIGTLVISTVVTTLSPDTFISDVLMSSTNVMPVQLQYTSPLRLKNARKALEEVSVLAGIPTPELKIIETPSMNAFACGLTHKSRSIVVTRGLLNGLTRHELKAVMAHEVTHLVNNDTLLMMTAYIFTGVLNLTISLGVFGILIGLACPGKHTGALIPVGMGIVILLWPWLILMILIRCCLSRKREYLADAGAIELTADPISMIKALKKIEKSEPLGAMVSGGSMMFAEPAGEKSFWGRFFDSHPSISSRIEFLEGISCQLTFMSDR